MNPLAFVSGLLAVTCFLLALFILKFARNRVHRLWACFNVSVGIWGMGICLASLSGSQEVAFRFWQFAHAGGFFVSVFFYHVVHEFCELKQRRFLIFVYAQAILFFVLNLFGITGYSAILTFGPIYYIKVRDFLYVMITILWFLPVIFGHLALFRTLSHTTGKRRNQIKYLLISMFIGFAGGIQHFLPVYNINVYPYGNLLITVYTLVATYAIFKHHLLDLEVVIKRTLVFTGLFATALVIVAVITTIAQSYIGQSARFAPIVSTALSVFIAILLYDPVRRFLERLTENVLFQKKIDYEKIEEDVSNSIKITDLDKLCQSLVDIFYEAMKLAHVILFLYEEGKKEFRIGAARGIGREHWRVLEDSDSLVQELRRENADTVYLKIGLVDHQKALSEGLDALRCEAVAKVVFENRLIALLCLGKKKSDEDFTGRDQQLLLKTANQMAVSISHATTFRIQRDYYYLQAQRNKSDALSNLSAGLAHEVKNPLHMIRPRIELLMEACESGIRPKDPKAMENLHTQLKHVDRIIKIMDRLRRFARPIEGEDIKLGPVALTPFVEEAIGLLGEKQLEDDDVKIEVKIPDDLPAVYAEETSLIQVFYNLIVNAHHAINRNGVIRIKAQDIPQDGRVLVEIEDTGKGIPPENLEKIFEPFFTTKPTNLPRDGSERFTGSGLGLAFVKRYMEDLGGSVVVTSQVGKGTTFYLKFLRSRGEKK